MGKFRLKSLRVPSLGWGDGSLGKEIAASVRSSFDPQNP